MAPYFSDWWHKNTNEFVLGQMVPLTPVIVDAPPRLPVPGWAVIPFVGGSLAGAAPVGVVATGVPTSWERARAYFEHEVLTWETHPRVYVRTCICSQAHMHTHMRKHIHLDEIIWNRCLVSHQHKHIHLDEIVWNQCLESLQHITRPILSMAHLKAGENSWILWENSFQFNVTLSIYSTCQKLWMLDEQTEFHQVYSSFYEFPYMSCICLCVL